MNNKRAKQIIQSIYNDHNSIYIDNFCRDLTLGYNALAMDNNELISVEPYDSKTADMLRNNYWNLSYRIIELVEYSIRSMFLYNRAYLLLKSDYDRVNNESLSIISLEGFISGREEDEVYFWRRIDSDTISQDKYESNRLIKLDLEDLGVSKKSMHRILKQIENNDTIKLGQLMMSNTEGYNYEAHSKRSLINMLRATKQFGWSIRFNELSDSLLLFRKIKQNEFKIKALKYVVTKINNAIADNFNKDETCKLVIHIKQVDYEKAWENYENGTITTEDLSNIVF